MLDILGVSAFDLSAAMQALATLGRSYIGFYNAIIRIWGRPYEYAIYDYFSRRGECGGKRTIIIIRSDYDA